MTRIYAGGEHEWIKAAPTRGATGPAGDGRPQSSAFAASILRAWALPVGVPHRMNDCDVERERGIENGLPNLGQRVAHPLFQASKF